MKPRHLRAMPSVTADATTATPFVSPETAARMIALPPTLKAWAREESLVRLHLARHVLHGDPLVDCIISIACAMGAGELRTRLDDGEDEERGLARALTLRVLRRPT